MFGIDCLLVQCAVLSPAELTGNVSCALSHGCQVAFDSGYSGNTSGATSDVVSFLIFIVQLFNLLQVVKIRHQI